MMQLLHGKNYVQKCQKMNVKKQNNVKRKQTANAQSTKNIFIRDMRI